MMDEDYDRKNQKYMTFFGVLLAFLFILALVFLVEMTITGNSIKGVVEDEEDVYEGIVIVVIALFTTLVAIFYLNKKD